MCETIAFDLTYDLIATQLTIQLIMHIDMIDTIYEECQLLENIS